MNKYTFLFPCLLFFFQSQGQVHLPSPLEVIEKMEEKMDAIHSLSYTVNCELKKMGSDSIRSRTFYLNAQRNKKNKAYHFDWQHKEENKLGLLQILYIGNDLNVISEKEKRITIYENEGKIDYSNYWETMRRWFLFDEIIYKDLHKEKSIEFSQKFSDEKYWVIEFQYPKGGKDVLWIDKVTYFPMKKMEVMNDGNLEQIFSFEIQKLKINEQLSKGIFNLKTYSKTYEINYFEKKEREEFTLADFEIHLTDAEIDTLFQTEFYHPTEGKLKLADAEGKLFLLDFWYLSCAPCLAMMPKMQQFHDTHHGAGLRVMGINWTDTKDVKYVAEKLKERGLTYNNYFADKKLADMLGVKAYPTVILVDKDKRVIYAGINSMLDHLENLILENL